MGVYGLCGLKGPYQLPIQGEASLRTYTFSQEVTEDTAGVSTE